MNKKGFSIYMQNEQDIEMIELGTKFIDRAIDIVFEDTIMGNYNFFCISNDIENSFMQCVFCDGKWHIEYRTPLTGMHHLQMNSDPNTIFYSYIEGKFIDLSDWEYM